MNKEILKSILWILLALIIFGTLGYYGFHIVLYKLGLWVKITGILATLFSGFMIVVISDFQYYKIKRAYKMKKKMNQINEIEKKIK